MTTTPAVTPGRPRVFRFADLELDEGRQRVLRNGIEVPLPKLSFDLLLALLDAAPNFLSNRQLMATVWPGLVIGDKTVTQRVKLLRDALGDDHEEPRYVAGLRGRGYCIPVPVTLVAAESDSASAPRAAGQHEARPDRTASPARRYAAVILVLAMAPIAWWLAGNLQRHAPADSATTAGSVVPNTNDIAVAVLPFRDPGGNAVLLAEGLPEAVIDRLSTMPGFSVIARNSSFRAANEGRSVADLGELLGVRYPVEGSVQREGDTLRVSAQLVDARTGTQVWSERFDRGIADVFRIQDEIAASVARALGTRAALLDESRPARPETSVSAYLSYLRGRSLLDRWTLADADAAVSAFELATELDPGFAAAYASLYDARLMAADRRCGHANPAGFHGNDPACTVDAVRKAERSLVERALELDPRSGTAYFARAIWAGDPTDARDADFRRGLQYDPSNGRGITAYAEFLDRSGRAAEAERMLERAIRVDPLSPRAYFWRVMRDDDADAAKLEAGMLGVLEIDPDYVPALQRYAKYRWILHGDIAQAIRLIEQALSLDPSSPWLRHTAIAMYLDIGDPVAAQELATAGEQAGAGRVLLLLHEGDAGGAANAAIGGLGFANGPYENWGVYDALREISLAGGETTETIRFLETHTGLGNNDARITEENFRAVPVYAQLLMLSGQPERARALLEECIRWIDEVHLPKLGGVYALRIKAEALLMLGDTDAALAALGASFEARDFVQWWYTIERDPLWLPLHDDPRFVSIAARVRKDIAQQKRELETMRARGAVPGRGAVSAGNSPP